MHNSLRSIGTAIAGLAVMTTGWLAPAPPAQAASSDTIIGTVHTALGEDCTSGWMDVFAWQPDSTADNGGHWDYRYYASIAAGSFSYDSTDLIGSVVSVRVYCFEGNFYRWYGGSLVRPGAPTAQNSRTVVAGTNDFGTFTLVAEAMISGKLVQADGSVFPAYDKGGTLLAADDDLRSEKAYFGFRSWVDVIEPGADPFSSESITSCYADSVGVVVNCAVPVTTVDLLVGSSGWDSRQRPGFFYPDTINLALAGYTVPQAGATGLLLKAATGLAARNTSVPKIGGTVKVGATVSASPGVWSELGYTTSDLAVSYQWLVNGSQVGTGETYLVAPADANKSLVLRVTATRPLYASATAESAAALVAVPDDTRLAPSMKLKFATVKHGKSAKVSVTVRAGGMGVLGKVVVSEGSKSLGSKTLVLKNQGVTKVTFKAPKAKGSHTLTVTYRGSAQVKGVAVSKVVKVK